MPDLSAIVVSHRSATEASACVVSLRAAFARDALAGEIVLVDCGSPPEDRALLASAGADRFLAIDNRGYSGGVNAGIAASRSHLLLFCNADTELDAGALLPLIEAARHENVAAAAPVQFADRQRRIMLPTGFGSGFFRDLAQTAWRFDAETRFARHARRQWKLWTEGGDAEYLAGSVLATRREVVDRIGRFDEGFSFEYEETEWEDRARTAGLRLRVVPQSRALHFPATSSKRNPDSERRRRESRRLYRRRRYGRLGRSLLEWAERCAPVDSNGPLAPRVVEAREGFAVAASPNPSLLPFVGIRLNDAVDLDSIAAAIGGPLFIRFFRTSDGAAEPTTWRSE